MYLWHVGERLPLGKGFGNGAVEELVMVLLGKLAVSIVEHPIEEAIIKLSGCTLVACLSGSGHRGRFCLMTLVVCYESGGLGESLVVHLANKGFHSDRDMQAHVHLEFCWAGEPLLTVSAL